MTKQDLINLIVLSLASQGVTCEVGTTTDINISQEFVDANIETAGKAIKYTSSALFSEEKSEIYFWELTMEQISEVSTDAAMETSFQAGKTLFRKVKSTVVGTDGKIIEHTFDLGQIQKTFHEIATKNGWKVKTALSQKKASYNGPVQGGVPTSPISDQPIQSASPSLSPSPTSQEHPNASQVYQEINQQKSKSKGWLLAGIIILLLVVAAIIVFFIYSSPKSAQASSSNEMKIYIAQTSCMENVL